MQLGLFYEVCNHDWLFYWLVISSFRFISWITLVYVYKLLGVSVIHNVICRRLPLILYGLIVTC